ncbi:MAG: hypothetical protein HDS78_03030 [Bacteroidales bacterium]|nr:hypothetical protein [Bacteroidales bacterium]
MIGILGESQTFVGVLTTVVVLCVVTESGNFVFKIFESIIESTIVEIHAIQNKVRNTITDLLKFWENSDLKELIQKADSFRQISDNKKSEIMTQQMLFELKTSQYSLSFSDKYFLPIFKQIELIKCSKEQTFSPLFIFAYSLIVFLCDEVVCWFGDLKPLMVTFLTFFTSTTFAYLLVIWIKFCREYHFKESEENDNGSPDSDIEVEDREYSVKSAVFTSICCCVIFLLVALILTIISKRVSTGPFFTWICRIALLGAVFIPIGLVAYRHSNLRRVQGQYRHRFLLVHFIGMVFVSMLYTAIVSISQLTPDCVLFPFSENLWLLKSSMIITIILNGIIFPFVFPYCGNNYVLKYTRQNSQLVIQNAGSTYKELEEWTQKTRAEINEIISQNTFRNLEKKELTENKKCKLKRILDVIFNN